MVLHTFSKLKNLVNHLKNKKSLVLWGLPNMKWAPLITTKINLVVQKQWTLYHATCTLAVALGFIQ